MLGGNRCYFKNYHGVEFLSYVGIPNIFDHNGKMI